MWNKPTQKQLAPIPKIFETGGIPLKDKLIYLHFFLGGNDWYVCEFDGKNMFYGYVFLMKYAEFAEWGNFFLSELENLKVGLFEVECESKEFWKVRPASEIEGIYL